MCSASRLVASSLRKWRCRPLIWSGAGAGRHRPRGGQNMATLHAGSATDLRATYKVRRRSAEGHFTDSEASQAPPRIPEALPRRTENRDPEVNEKVAPARSRPSASGASAVRVPMSISRPSWQPTLVINGERRDHLFHQLLDPAAEHPQAQLIIYPDANHVRSLQDRKLVRRLGLPRTDCEPWLASG